MINGAARHSILLISLQPALPNGPDEEIKKELTADAANKGINEEIVFQIQRVITTSQLNLVMQKIVIIASVTSVLIMMQ